MKSFSRELILVKHFADTAHQATSLDSDSASDPDPMPAASIQIVRRIDIGGQALAQRMLPHPIHATGGFVIPRNVIDLTKRQDGRDLTRFNTDFDLPERFLAAFPPLMYLVQRPDLDT
jgi:hypothetical protein